MNSEKGTNNTMQGIIVLTIVILSSAFSFPSHKDEPQQDLEKKITSSSSSGDFTRTQRNLVQFHNMIKCTTSRSSSFYVDYGCYCGYGGTGNPLDATDRCCQVHDECYGRIMNDPDLCRFSSSVYWKIYSRDDTCTGCADEEGSCGRAICECDGAAARCFAESEWNEEHFNWPPEQC